MYLKSVEIQGFKSFPDKVKFEFDKGVTAVVGPNGSGKSNIADAVRWVLGEQSSKTLRGGKMEDVIFSGTQTRKPMGFAQVTLNLDNSARDLPIDSDEIAVTRRLYRSSESENLINGSNVRLKDVRELFMDTGLGRDGYSIIGQGKIAEIVGAKSDDRREIFEEAAGIAKFRHKKEEAERKLAQAQENILRLKDIIVELEERVGPLKRDSEKAQIFIKLSEYKKTLDVSVGIARLEEYKISLRDIEDKIMIGEGEYVQLEADIDEFEQQISQMYEKSQECLENIEQKRRAISELEKDNASSSSDAAVLRNDIEHSMVSIEKLHKQQESSTESFSGIDEEMKNKQDEIKSITDEIKKLDTVLADTRAEFEELSKQSESFAKEQEALSTELNKALLNRSECKISIASTQGNFAQTQERLESINGEIERHELDITTLKSEQTEMVKSFEELEAVELEQSNRLTGFTRLLNGKKEKLNEVKQSYDALTRELETKKHKAQTLKDIEHNMEGYQSSVKEVINAGKSGRLSGLHGTVAQLINVDNKYSLAIELALGAAMQNIVVENEDIAKRCILFLKERNAGRATFLPITSVKGNTLTERELNTFDGYCGLAYELVEYDSKYDGIFKSLLGRIAVVEDIDSATRISKRFGYRFRIVTMDGQIINAGGSFTGGSSGRSAGMLSRRNDISVLEAEIERATTKLTQAEASFKTFKAEVDKLTIDVEGVNEQLAELKSDKIRITGEQNRITALLAQGERQLVGMNAEQNRLRELADTQESTATQQATEHERLSAEVERLEGILIASSGKNDGIIARREELSQHLSSKRINQIELGKDIESIQRQILSLEAQKQSISEGNAGIQDEIKKIEQEIADKKLLIESKTNNVSDNGQRISECEQDIEKLLKLRAECEQLTTQLRAKSKSTSEAREKHSREVARLQERKITAQRDYDNIIAELWEQYQLTRSEAEQIAAPIENMLAAQKELTEIRGKIKVLGNVNVSAIEEYKEVSERYEFLSCQLADVENSKQELENLIADLTGNICERFNTAFEQINANFKEIFIELFGGGKAEIVLSEPDNVLESGIEINVTPPGKVIKNLASLSGGEQSFVAIAIYFAILKYNPAPFCILDEIEAALDDVNVTRYATFLRTFSRQTQFILITHRRGTMEQADVLYGVTMQEKGVSKLLKMQAGDTIIEEYTEA